MALDFDLTFAGISFVSDVARVIRLGSNLAKEQEDESQIPPRKHQPLVDLVDELNKMIDDRYLNDFALDGYNRKTDALAKNVGPIPNPRIGDFYYPTGATRWSVFRGLATSKQVKAMQDATVGGIAALFAMQQVPTGPNANLTASYTINTNLRMLPPRPLAEHAGGLEGLFLVTLVDERYWWNNVVTLNPNDISTWSSLLSTLATALGVSFSFGSIDAVYGQPDPDSQLWVSQENAAVLLDAVAFNIGRVFVRNLDGTYILRTAAEAVSTVTTNITDLTARTAGGNLFSSGISELTNLLNSRNTAVPAGWDVTFPKYVLEPIPHYFNTRYGVDRPTTWWEDSYGEVNTIHVPITSGGTYASGVSGVSNNILQTTAKSIYDTEANANLSGTALNHSGCHALALQLVKDRYDWTLGYALDVVFPGIVAWTPDGLHDIVWRFSERTKQASTRVVKTQWNQFPNEFQHVVPVSGSFFTSGVGGQSVPLTVFGGGLSGGVSGTPYSGINFGTNILDFFGPGVVVSGERFSGGLSIAHIRIIGRSGIASGSIVSGDIASGTVGWPHMSSGYMVAQSGVILDYTVGPPTVGYGMISGQVQSGYIGDNAVNSGNLSSGQVAWPHLSSGAVRSGHVADAAVNSGNIASGQVTWPHHASGYLAAQSGLLINYTPGPPTIGLTILSGPIQMANQTSSPSTPPANTSAIYVDSTGMIHSKDSAGGVCCYPCVPTNSILDSNVLVHLTFDQQSLKNFGTIGDPTEVLTATTTSSFVTPGLDSSDYAWRLTDPGDAGSNGGVLRWTESGDNWNLSATDEFLWIGWVQYTTEAVSVQGFNYVTLPSGVFSLILESSTNTLTLSYGSGTVASSVTLDPGTKYFVAAWRSESDGKIYIRVNGTTDEAVVAGTAIEPTAASSIDMCQAASSDSATSYTATWDGVIYKVGSAVAPTTAQLDEIYNNGTGLANPGCQQIPDSWISQSSVTQHESALTITKSQISNFTVVSGDISSGSVQGYFGATRHIASGTVGVYDFGSGAVIAGTVGSGAVQSGNVASGTIGFGHLANASVQSGTIASGIVGFPHLGNASVRSGTVASGQVTWPHLASGYLLAQSGLLMDYSQTPPTIGISASLGASTNSGQGDPNYVINGGMAIMQRYGTSGAVADVINSGTTDIYTADRFKAGVSSGGSFLFQQWNRLTSGWASGAVSEFYGAWQVGKSGHKNVIYQPIEAVNAQNLFNKPLTYQVKVKTPASSGIFYRLGLLQTNSGVAINTIPNPLASGFAYSVGTSGTDPTWGSGVSQVDATAIQITGDWQVFSITPTASSGHVCLIPAIWANAPMASGTTLHMTEVGVYRD